MKLLLDTQIMLWWLNDDQKLKPNVKLLIENPKNRIYLSVITPWEVVIKKQKGKLNFKDAWFEYFEKERFTLIEVRMEHVLELLKLKKVHGDPFDRMLAAQARVEKLTIVTADPKIEKYEVKVVRA